MKLMKYAIIFLLGALLSGIIMSFTSRHLSLGREYNLGYFDCIHDQAEEDPAVIDELYKEREIQI
jgi:hypothetical protein